MIPVTENVFELKTQKRKPAKFIIITTPTKILASDWLPDCGFLLNTV